MNLDDEPDPLFVTMRGGDFEGFKAARARGEEMTFDLLKTFWNAEPEDFSPKIFEVLLSEGYTTLEDSVNNSNNFSLLRYAVEKGAKNLNSLFKKAFKDGDIDRCKLATDAGYVPHHTYTEKDFDNNVEIFENAFKSEKAHKKRLQKLADCMLIIGARLGNVEMCVFAHKHHAKTNLGMKVAGDQNSEIVKLADKWIQEEHNR